MPIRAHILTDIDPRIFCRQAPGKTARWGDVVFTFGLTLPRDAEVMILYTRASWTIPTHLPRGRIAFVAGEPEDIHPYATGFLNQFGLVVIPGERDLDTERLLTSAGLPWFVGMDFNNLDAAWGYDDLSALPVPQKDDRISIVTSRKASTPYHRQRLAFIDLLKERLPDRIVLYGREFNPVADKADALLPHRYHLALENGRGRYAWTEKLADPLLCWALPFYVGCENVEDELPTESIVRLDLSDPEMAITQIENAIENNAWQARFDALSEARRRVLDEHNALALFARIAKRLHGHQTKGPTTTIRSERSMWPEKGARGSVPEFLLRRSLLTLDPSLELRLARWKQVRRA